MRKSYHRLDKDGGVFTQPLSIPATVVHHGIDIEKFEPADKQNVRATLGLPEGRLIGCFGRIRHQKGTDVFVDAELANMGKHLDITGIILGRANEKHQPFKKDLKAQTPMAGMTDGIRFCGEVPVDEIPLWYQALDLFVARQRWEGFSLPPRRNGLQYSSYCHPYRRFRGS